MSFNRFLAAPKSARLALSVAAATLLTTTAGLALAAESGAPQVKTAQGAVRGQVVAGVAAFRAIPYGAPPVGSLRFHSPQPPVGWTGVRDAVADGPSCPQAATLDPAGKASTDEDCLRLNVFAPAGTSKAKRPVMVWIHGGGFNEGFGGARQYDPSTLVKEGGLVVVTINYRMGAFGLLATKSLDEADGEPSGNNALRDQQAALRWVQQNIAAFGGDPRKVTIDGESAGAASVLALVTSPQSKGLFRGAIAQSPPDDSHAYRRAELEQTGEALAEALGCKAGPDQAACLRKLPVDAILKVRKPLGLVEDPKGMPVDPHAAYRDGTFNRVPMIIGSNLHEGYFHISGAENSAGHAMTAAEYAAQMKTRIGEGADQAMKLYPSESAPSPAAAVGNAMTDINFSCQADMARSGASNYVPIFGFEMNEPDPVQQQPRKQYSLANTSYHTADLAYLFDYAATGPLTGDAAKLGRKLRGYWIAFIKTGSPNRKGLPAWPAFHDASGKLLELSNAGGETTDFAARHRCAELHQAGLVQPELK